MVLLNNFGISKARTKDIGVVTQCPCILTAVRFELNNLRSFGSVYARYLSAVIRKLRFAFGMVTELIYGVHCFK